MRVRERERVWKKSVWRMWALRGYVARKAMIHRFVGTGWAKYIVLNTLFCYHEMYEIIFSVLSTVLSNVGDSGEIPRKITNPGACKALGVAHPVLGRTASQYKNC